MQTKPAPLLCEFHAHTTWSDTTATATSGSSRTSAARNKARRRHHDRSSPNSFLYRYVPAQPGDLRNGKLQVLQALNDRRATPITVRRHKPSLNNARPASRCTRTASVFKTTVDHASTTRPSTAHDPFNANDAGQGDERHAVQASRRTASSVPAPGFRDFDFTETGDTSSASTLPGRYGAVFHQLTRFAGREGHPLTPFFIGNKTHTGLDNIQFPPHDQLARGRGRRRHSARPAERARLRLGVRPRRRLRRGRPPRWLAEGRDSSATRRHSTARASAKRRRQRDHRYPRSNGDNRSGVPAPRSRTLTDKHWRWFYTQQHGDNLTYELLYENAG